MHTVASVIFFCTFASIPSTYMMDILEHVDLTSYNTFGIKVTSRYFTSISSIDELKALLQLKIFRENQKLVLGGGSNILFLKNFFDGLIIKNALIGIEKTREDENHVWLKVGAGEEWHAFVLHCIAQDFGGVENLSLIPGSVGAAPMQNIGAYGTEVKDVIESVEVLDITNGQVTSLTNAMCRFGYRESIFKQEGKDRYFITHVVFRLTKKNHRFNVSYGAIKEVLTKMNISELTLRSISDAVIAIRQSKLPDPKHVGNAGSFFKNPTIALHVYRLLQEKYPLIPSYPVDDARVKVPAGWLIEQCEWKGKKLGRVGVHAQQALVLVNYGGGTGEEIFNLAHAIQQSVKDKFNIDLQMEVNVV
jgi:UDP-N-acetylmuramate dehydrogenase